MQLRHTRDLPSPASSVPNRLGCNTNFIPRSSPGEAFTTATRSHEDTITILDLASGKPRLTVDAGMAILCLRAARDRIVAVGEGKIVTWKLPTGDCTIGARANVNDSVQGASFNHLHLGLRHLSTTPPCASVSLDLNRIAILTRLGGKNVMGSMTCPPGSASRARQSPDKIFSQRTRGSLPMAGKSGVYNRTRTGGHLRRMRIPTSPSWSPWGRVDRHQKPLGSHLVATKSQEMGGQLTPTRRGFRGCLVVGGPLCVGYGGSGFWDCQIVHYQNPFLWSLMDDQQPSVSAPRDTSVNIPPFTLTRLKL